MKKFLLLTATLVSHLFISAQVLIDDSQNSDETPHPKAILELRSTSKGLLLPRVEGTSAITNPQAGMIVFDKTNSTFKGYNGTNWVAFSSPASSGGEETPTATNVDFTGNLTVGQELQGTYTYSGGTEGTSLYSWNSATDASGTGKSGIADTQNYMLTSNEVGKYVQFCVTPTNTNGSSGQAACSAWKGTIQDSTPATNEEILKETFNDLKAVSGQQWKGNDNFPTVKGRVFPEDKAIKLGSKSGFGSITSKNLDFDGGNITVTLKVKSWNSGQSKIKVSIGSEERFIEDYSSTDYEEKTAIFNNVIGTGTVTIETLSSESEKRAIINKVVITKE